MKAMIRILLADDHKLLRSGIRSLLDGLDDIEVVAEASNAIDAIELVKKLQPDVALLDIAMPGMSGLDAADQIAALRLDTKVVILSMHQDEEYVKRALKSGVAGYLLKDAGIEELEIAIRAVARGESFLSPAASKHLIADFRKRSDSEKRLDEILSPRQIEVLRMIAEGDNTKTIARKLEISVKTVESHRAQLMNKLEIHDVAGLVRYAIRFGLVDRSES
jgi:DNA-binding NarL/FixJ family response regulator